jgi:hypothetical protein
MSTPTQKSAPAGSVAAEAEASMQQSNVEPEVPDSDATPDFLFGWRLYLTTFGYVPNTNVVELLGRANVAHMYCKDMPWLVSREHGGHHCKHLEPCHCQRPPELR